MRRWGCSAVAAVALTAAGCLDVSHQCTDSTQCVRGKIPGVCGVDGQCRFFDDDAGPPDAATDDDATTADAATDAPAIDARPIDASIDDDGDGVLNTVDNCPRLANPDQHDEDGDAVGDVCDGCPHLADPMQANLDDDGLGDACDPRPTIPGNLRLLFEPFTDASLGAWTAHAGAWAQNGDAMVVAGDATISRISRPITVGVGQHVVVETRATVTAVTITSGTAYLGLADPVDFVVGTGRGCALYDNPATVTAMEAMAVEVGAASLTFTRVGLFAASIAPPLTATIKHTRTTERRCDVTVGANPRGGTYSELSDLPITRVGLFARHVGAAYAYVFAYSD